MPSKLKKSPITNADYTVDAPVAVVGLGAIGGLIAARLIRSGHSVISVGRNAAWVKQIRRHGLRISGKGFGFGTVLKRNQLHPVNHPRRPICSAVIICVKSGDTRSAISKIRPLVGPETAILSLQNGLTHPKQLTAAFGHARTVFGVTLVAANRPGPFHVRHEKGEDIWLSPHPKNAEALELIQDMLHRCRWKVRIVPSEDRLLWTKALFNAATNPIGALTNRTNGELINIPALRELVLRTMKEAFRAGGHNPIYSYPAIKRLLLQKGDAPNQPNSMLQDIRAGRKTEIDAIIVPFLYGARRRREPVPTLESLYRFVKRLEGEVLTR